MDEPSAPPPGPAPRSASFTSLLSPLTVLAVLAGGVAAGYLAWLRGSAAGYDPAYLSGYVGGSVVGVIAIALLAGAIACALSKRKKRPTNLTTLIVMLVVVVSGARENFAGAGAGAGEKEEAEGNSRIVAEMAREASAMKGKLRELHEEGDDLNGAQAEEIRKAMTKRLREQAGRLEGALAEFMEGFLEFQGELENANSEYQAALEPMAGADYYDLATATSTADLDVRIEQARKFKRSAENFRAAFRQFDGVSRLRRKLERPSEKDYARGMMDEFARMAPIATELRDLDGRYADLLVLAFEIVKKEWGKFGNPGLLGELVMENGEAGKRIAAILTEMEEIGAKQSELQGRLLR